MLRTERDFEVNKKAFFIIFINGLSVAKRMLRPGSAPLIKRVEQEG